MKEKYLYVLLQIVDKNGDVRQLIREGINYKDVGDLTTLALKEEYLLFKDKRLTITQKGLDKIDADSTKFKKINKSEWILPDFKNRIKKIDKNDIFLPKQDELSF